MIFFKLANGWIYGEIYSDSSKVQPLMKPYKLLSEKVRLFFLLLSVFFGFVVLIYFEFFSLLYNFLLKYIICICLKNHLYLNVL